MKRSIGKTLLGCAALALWAAFLFFVWIYSTAPTARNKEGAAILAVTLAMCATGAAVFWFVWSAVDWIIRRSARVSAEHDALVRARSAVGAWGNPPPPPAGVGTGASPVLCGVCGQHPASFLCVAHGWAVCAICSGDHLRAGPGCRLTPYPPLTAQPADRPRPVATSPLSGVR